VIQKYQIENNSKRYNEKIEIAIFRILQESLTNVARHSNASEVEINLLDENEFLILTVKDNGIGMGQDGSTGGKGIGLTGIKERAKLVNGELEMKTENGKGTEIRVKIPKVYFSTSNFDEMSD
ncbi:MAG TPA: hypothetical protein DIS94_00980, partial [Bacteroidetes bacterium]|nr:hypothetical protein [Bacteroidota bacterium]